MKITLPWWLPLALLAALALAIALGVGQCQARQAAEAETKRVGEAARLERDGFQVARTDLETARDMALDDLSKALANQGIHSKPVVIVDGTTGPVGGPGLTAPSPSSGPAQAPAAGGTSPAAGCLLTDKDQGEIRVSGGAVKTDAGNYVVQGQADAYALNPERHLFGGPLHLNVHVPPSPVPPASQQGPGAGWAVTIGADRIRTGPVAALPSFRALWLNWSPSINVQCEPGQNVCAKDERGHSTLTLGLQLVGSR